MLDTRSLRGALSAERGHRRVPGVPSSILPSLQELFEGSPKAWLETPVLP